MRRRVNGRARVWRAECKSAVLRATLVSIAHPSTLRKSDALTGYRRCMNPLYPSLETVGSQWFTKFIDRFVYLAMSDADSPSAIAACLTAKSPTAYYTCPWMRYWNKACACMSSAPPTSSARDASRVGSPVAPDGSTQSVGMYPKVFHAVFWRPTIVPALLSHSIRICVKAHPYTSWEAALSMSKTRLPN